MMSNSRRHFDDWIASYIDLFDPITETPSNLHFWTAVSAIAGALTRRVWIDEITFRYYPNFCIIFVAPPGIVSKSTTLSHGMALLRELPQVKFAADTTTFPAFVRALALASETFMENEKADIRLSEWMSQCAMTAAISELGTFLKIEDEDSVNGLTDLLDCRDLAIKDTKNNGRDEVEYPFVNIIGATTPQWIQDKLKAQIGGWGLSSRIVFAYAEKKKQYLWSPADAIADRAAFDRTRVMLVDDLRKIGGLNGPLRLDPTAADRCKAWYNETQRRIEAYGRSPDYDNWTGYFLARKPVHMRKLSMILSIARRSSLIINDDDVVDAITKMDEIERDITSVFRVKPMPSTLALTEQAILDRVVEEMAAAGPIRKQAVLSRISRFVDSTSAGRILDNAVARGIFAAEIKSGGVAWLSLKTDQ